MKYMIVFDESDKLLIDNTLADAARLLRDDCEDRYGDLATRLEALAIVPVPEDTPIEADQATGAVEPMPLVASLIHASMSQTAATQQALIDGLQWDIDRLQATLQLITNGIYELCSHEWTPNVKAILAALYPSSEDVTRHAEGAERDHLVN